MLSYANRLISLIQIRYRKTLRLQPRLLWEWLITPSNGIEQPELLRQSRLLAAMLAVVVPLGLLIATFSFIFAHDFYNGHWLAYLAISFLGLAYLLNRSGRFLPAAWITVIVPSLAIFVVTFFTEMQPVNVDFLALLFLPLLIASAFLAEKIVQALAALYIAGVLLSPVFVPGIGLVEIMLGPAFFMAVASGMISLLNRHRRDLEQDRRRELVEKEERYRTLFEGANDAIFLLSLENIYVAANHKAANMLGYTVEELVGRGLSEVLAPEDYPDALRARTVLLAGETFPLTERIFRKKDGTEFPVEINLALIHGRDGKPDCIQSIVRDISERKRTEARMQRQLERLKALREIDRMITASLDLQVTLQVVLNHVVAQLGCDAAGILLLDPHLVQLEYFADRGFPRGLVSQERLSLEETLAGRAASEGRLVSGVDLTAGAKDSPRLALLAAQGFRVGSAVPLVAKGLVKGVLEVFHRQSFEPPLEWIDFLETLGGQAAIAIDSAELFRSLQRTNLELVGAYDATLEGWAKALELRDEETEGHSQRVTQMALRLGRALGIDEAGLVHLRRGALLHDIGKMGIPDSILLKPGPLTEEEWEVMKRHPVYAYEMLSPVPFLKPALDIPYCHHEKWDGGAASGSPGYPRGLAGEQIPLAARIFAVVDVWDALSSDRPYRPAWPEGEVYAYIQDQSGRQFDPQVVEAFMRLFRSEI
jgi:PAS domain S-box-containing protein